MNLQNGYVQLHPNGEGYLLQIENELMEEGASLWISKEEVVKVLNHWMDKLGLGATVIEEVKTYKIRNAST